MAVTSRSQGSIYPVLRRMGETVAGIGTGARDSGRTGGYTLSRKRALTF